MVGGNANDLISGNEGNDLIDGGAGDDTLRGDAGADTIRGGAGYYDRIYADGADVLIDGGGDGAIVYLESSAVVRLGGVAGPGEVLMLNVWSLQGNSVVMDVHAAADWATRITIGTGNGDDVIVTGSGNDDITYGGVATISMPATAETRSI